MVLNPGDFPEPEKHILHGWKQSSINRLPGDQSHGGLQAGSLNQRGLPGRGYKAGIT